MQISSNLQLVFPIRWSDGENPVPLLWAYHTPIPRTVFEMNWRIITATAATLLKKGVSPSVIAIATLALKDAGRQDALEYGLPDGLSFDDGGSAATLLGEMKRLTLILSPGAGGYERLPVDVAIDRKIIDAEDWSEAEDALVFFTCGWWIATRQRRVSSGATLASVLGGSITSLKPTEWAASLTTSTPIETSPPEPVAEVSMAIPQ